MASKKYLLSNEPINDKVALAFFSGTLGTLVMYSIGIPMYIADISQWIYLLYSIELFVTPEIARTMPGMLLGFITGLIAGGTLALGFILLINWTSSNWYWLKTLAYGLAIWFVWVGVLRNFLGANVDLQKDLTSNIVLLFQSIIYSFVTAYLIDKFSDIVEKFKNIDT